MSKIIPLVDFGYQQFDSNPTKSQIFQFMIDCIKEERIDIADDIENNPYAEKFWQSSFIVNTEALKQALDLKQWTIWDEITSEEFFENITDETAQTLYYLKNNKPIKIKQDLVKTVYSIGMRYWDTRYRIYLFLTHDNTLYLGTNEPD